jgi:hypothetical protein
MRALIAVALVALAGCALPTDPAAVREGIARDPSRAAAVENLPHVPSPRGDDCGASALATALAAAGAPRSLDEVRAAVLDPARGGAPASSLVRYARAQSVFALARETWYLDDLKEWVRAGVAPIVAIWVAPGTYHYVLLTGFDDERRVVLLRDQLGPEMAMSYGDFFPRWCDAHAWALVVASPSIELPPSVPLTARELGALGWLAEKSGDLKAARRHYRAALERDPGMAAAANNLANVEKALATR